MKLIRVYQNVFFSLVEASRLSAEEEQEYRRTAPFGIYQGPMVGIPDREIELKHLKRDDFNELRGRQAYHFGGKNSVGYEVTDEEWDAFVSLNEKAAAAKAKEDRDDEIFFCLEIIKRAEAQRDIPTKKVAERRMEKYRQAVTDRYSLRFYEYMDECKSIPWDPFIVIDIDWYNEAKARLQELLDQPVEKEESGV